MKNPFRRKPKIESVNGIKVLQRVEDLDISLVPGDTLTLTYEAPGIPRQTVLTETVTEAMRVNTALAISVTNALGLKSGLGGIFGESNGKRN